MGGYGPDMAYRSEGLRDGGARAATAGSAAEAAQAQLVVAAITGGAFGDVEIAEDLGTALEAVRRGADGVAAAVRARHERLDAGAHSAAAQGDELDVVAAAIAGAISAGMLG